MSDINLDFTVSNSSIDFTVQPNDITITPTDIQLTLYGSGAPVAGGNVGELQYNTGGVLGGVSNVTSDGSNVTFVNTSNIKIGGGTNHYYLQTDGTGNLTWAVGTGNMQGNGTVAGANTQIQFNDGGANFGGNAGFTFDKTTGNVNIPGNLTVIGTINGNIANANYANYAGNVVVSSQPNITSLGTLVSLTVTGNINTTGTTSIQQAKEKVTSNNTGSTGTINYDLLDQAIIYKTANATANFTLNFRGNSTTTLDSIMSSNQSMTCTYINTNGNTGYLATAFSIDGNAITPNWLNGDTPVFATVNAKDMYSFNILKTNSNTFVVFGTAGGYY
jgi:hypothetical protein